MVTCPCICDNLLEDQSERAPAQLCPSGPTPSLPEAGAVGTGPLACVCSAGTSCCRGNQAFPRAEASAPGFVARPISSRLSHLGKLPPCDLRSFPSQQGADTKCHLGGQLPLGHHAFISSECAEAFLGGSVSPLQGTACWVPSSAFSQLWMSRRL